MSTDRPDLRPLFEVGALVVHRLHPNNVGRVASRYNMTSAAGLYRLKYSVEYAVPPHGISKRGKRLYGIAAENEDLSRVLTLEQMEELESMP